MKAETNYILKCFLLSKRSQVTDKTKRCNIVSAILSSCMQFMSLAKHIPKYLNTIFLRYFDLLLDQCLNDLCMELQMRNFVCLITTNGFMLRTYCSVVFNRNTIMYHTHQSHHCTLTHQSYVN